MDANKYVELRIYPTYFCVDAKTARGRVPLAAMAESRYSLFTAAQFLRRWISVLTQTVTQTRKNQVELSVLETTKLRNFLSRKVRKCLEMSAKNIRPTFGNRNLPHLTRQKFYWFSATATMQQLHCLTAISHSFKIYCACRLLAQGFWRIIYTRSVGS